MIHKYYTILYKNLERLWVLESLWGLGTTLLQIPRRALFHMDSHQPGNIICAYLCLCPAHTSLCVPGSLLVAPALTLAHDDYLQRMPSQVAMALMFQGTLPTFRGATESYRASWWRTSAKARHRQAGPAWELWGEGQAHTYLA